MASILDIKRCKDDFIKKKGKSSEYTKNGYSFIFKHLEKFCLNKYNSSLEELIEELALTENCQEQVENLLQSYIDELETENKSTDTVMGYASLAKNYLKYRRVKFDKDELDLSYKNSVKEELHPITKKEIKSLMDNSNFVWKTKIFMMSSGGFRISELLGVRKCDINRELERYSVYIRAEFAKGHRARTTLISIEAMEYLDKLLENMNENDLLFPHETKIRRNAVMTNVIYFQKIAEKAGLNMRYENSNTHKITTHSFRSFFVSQFEKTFSGFGHALSGHSKYMKQYERFTMGEKIEKYIETEKHLLIYSENDQKEKRELTELKVKVARLEGLLDDKVKLQAFIDSKI